MEPCAVLSHVSSTVNAGAPALEGRDSPVWTNCENWANRGKQKAGILEGGPDSPDQLFT